MRNISDKLRAIWRVIRAVEVKTTCDYTEAGGIYATIKIKPRGTLRRYSAENSAGDGLDGLPRSYWEV